MDVKQLLLVFIGAGFGGVGRYLLGPMVQRLANEWTFPIGTFSVNMVGCFCIGFLAQLSECKGLFQPDIRLFLFVGLLGGFTTFSSFGYETFQLLRSSEYVYALANALGQVIVGMIFLWLGYLFARLL